MNSAHNKAVARHRERRRRQGLVRVEVQVSEADSGLVRGVAAALTDPAREKQARDLLRRGLGLGQRKSLKTLLAEAPLEGIDLERADDTGRDVDL